MNVDEKIKLYKSFPQKRIGAGVLIFDEGGKIMIVKPTYRDDWLLPGGVSEVGESPMETARREVKEEIGLDLVILRPLIVDYKSNIIGDTYVDDFVSFIFLAETIGEEKKGEIVLQIDELSDYKFVEFEDACSLLVPSIGRRIKNWGRNFDGFIYMENGKKTLG
jgi:8-oxo-dGTP diphosphatase